MSASNKPISDLVRQGWAVEHYSAALGGHGVVEHCFHMSRSGAMKVIVVRSKILGSGVEVTELEV